MTNDSEKRTWEGRARPSMGSIDLCISCGETDTAMRNGRCQNVPSSSHDWLDGDDHGR
jgi:hypothetical protein